MKFTMRRKLRACASSAAALALVLFVGPAQAAPPSAADIQASLEVQLVPPDTPLTVAIELETRGYSLPYRVITRGVLQVEWFLSKPGDGEAGTLIARGFTRFGKVHQSQLKIEATAAGRSMFRTHSAIRLIAVGTFTSGGQAPVSAAQSFAL